jgi:cytochrome c peroxidase
LIKNIRGEEDNFTASEKNGVNLFMGKALCATCHFMPLTNGTVLLFIANQKEK